MALVLFASFGLALVLASRLQRLISAPILRLTHVTGEVTAGRRYDLRVETSGRDEIGQLIDGFNTMLREIQSRDARLTEQKDQLEYTVERRTSELRLANTDLVVARNKASPRVEHLSTGSSHLMGL